MKKKLPKPLFLFATPNVYTKRTLQFRKHHREKRIFDMTSLCCVVIFVFSKLIISILIFMKGQSRKAQFNYNFLSEISCLFFVFPVCCRRFTSKVMCHSKRDKAPEPSSGASKSETLLTRSREYKNIVFPNKLQFLLAKEIVTRNAYFAHIMYTIPSLQICYHHFHLNTILKMDTRM
jgi:hypothetical protein